MANLKSRLFTIWLALVALTFVSFGSREGAMQKYIPEYTVVILSALMKVRFVILDFMQVRTAPLILRVLLEGWIIVLSVVLLILYY